MANVINSLTSEQEALMSEFTKKGISVGLSTESVSEEETVKIVLDVYKYILENKEIPEVVIKRSPKEAWKYIQTRVGSKISFVQPYLSGSIDSNVFAFYDYMFEVLKIEVPEELKKKYEIWKATTKLGYLFTFDDVCIVCEKAKEIHTKNNVIHNENGPAIRWSDDFELYYLNGVKVSKEIVMTSWDKMDSNLIITEENAEVRREVVRKIGLEKICKDLKAVIIDKLGDYELLTLKLSNSNERPYLKMKNPSIGVYHIEGVTPNCKTVMEALVSRKPNEMKEIPIDDKKGDDWFQQGDVCVWNKDSKSLKMYPKILT